MSAREKMFADALALPVAERAKLVGELLESLDDADAEEMWAAEIEKRAREVFDGKAELVDWEDVEAEVRSRYGD